MDSLTIVCKAYEIIKSDNMKYLSEDIDNSLFWNEPFSGLGGQQKQDYNNFYRINSIDVSKIKKGFNKDISQVFMDYDDMMTRLIEEPTHKLKMGTQMTVIIIIGEALKYYGHNFY